MFTMTVLTFFLALFFSIVFLVKLTQFIVRCAVIGSGEVTFLNMFLPALFWTLFYGFMIWR